jgi:hypothetical protein
MGAVAREKEEDRENEFQGWKRREEGASKVKKTVRTEGRTPPRYMPERSTALAATYDQMQYASVQAMDCTARHRDRNRLHSTVCIPWQVENRPVNGRLRGTPNVKTTARKHGVVPLCGCVLQHRPVFKEWLRV